MRNMLGPSELNQRDEVNPTSGYSSPSTRLFYETSRPRKLDQNDQNTEQPSSSLSS